MVAAIAIAAAIRAPASPVTVYVQGLSVVPAVVLSRAQALADEMFAGVNVKIDWRRGVPGRSRSWRERAIRVEMVSDTPRERTPDALAFSLPYEGVHITVFYDRVRQRTQPDLTPILLAHVLVHEITHILEGTSGHTDRGVMKARWNEEDLLEMRQRALPFTEENIRLIAFGLAQRTGAGALIAAIPH